MNTKKIERPGTTRGVRFDALPERAKFHMRGGLNILIKTHDGGENAFDFCNECGINIHAGDMVVEVEAEIVWWEK